MKTNPRRLISVVTLSALMSCGVTMAAGPSSMPGPAAGPVPFTTYDANGDGRVSADEFYDARNARIAERVKQGGMMRNLGNAPAFEQFDRDGDGYLSENELLRGQVSHMQQQRMNRQRGPMGGAGRGGGMASFTDFDRNGDGAVTPDEFAQTRAARQASKATQGGTMRNAGSAPSFDSFDRNGDGRLTPDEFVPGNRNRMQ